MIESGIALLSICIKWKDLEVFKTELPVHTKIDGQKIGLMDWRIKDIHDKHYIPLVYTWGGGGGDKNYLEIFKT